MHGRLPLFIARHPRLCASLLGAVAACGFAPLSLWPLTIAALAALIALLYRTTVRRDAFLLGWAFGVGHCILGLNWIATAFTYQAAMPAWLGWVAVVLLSLYLAIFPGFATLAAWGFTRSMARRPMRAVVLPFAFAAAWIVTEWLRSWLFTGFAWNPLAAIAPWAASPAAIVGTYGQSGLIALFSGAVWLAVRGARRDAAIVVAPAIVMGVAGWVAAALTDSNPVQPVPITIVQPNIGQGDKWDMRHRAENFRKLAALSPRRNDADRPRLLLWPEAAVPDYLESGYPLDWYVEPPSFARSRLAALLGPGDLLLTGAVKLEPNADRTDIVAARNSVFTLDAGGRLGQRYDKAHLVPYGEYLPMRPILSAIGLSRLAPGAVDFLPGPGPRTLSLPGFGKVGVQICYEIIFSGHVVDRNDRPDFIFNPSNDAWFGGWGPPQHLAQARLRAIEEGLPVIRATPTGISAVIGADGKILDSIPMHRAGRIDTMAPPADDPTLFAMAGNILPLIFAGLMIVIAVAIGRRQS